MATLPDSLLANEIAAAIFRVADLIGNERLKQELENSAIDLVLTETLETIKKLEDLIRLGLAIEEIKLINAQVLLRELGHLRENIESIKNQPKPELDLEKEFGNLGRVGELGQEFDYSANWQEPGQNGRVTKGQYNIVVQYANKTPEFRFKDIQAAFPEISERTLRRIIQTLIKKGELTRVGKPGPTSFYKKNTLPQAAVSVEEGLPSVAPPIGGAKEGSSSEVLAKEGLPSEALAKEKLSTAGNPASIIAL